MSTNRSRSTITVNTPTIVGPLKPIIVEREYVGPEGPQGPSGPRGPRGRDGLSTLDPVVYTLMSPSITLSIASNVVVLAAAELPTVTTAAVGMVSSKGLVVAAHTGVFGTHRLDQVPGKHLLSPKNLITIIDQDTGTAPMSDNARPVFGLLQSECAANSHTVSGNTPTRLQISLVRLNLTFDALEEAPVSDFSGGMDIKYTYNTREVSPITPDDAFIDGPLGGVGGGGGGGAGWIYIEDITVAGGETISNHVWLDPPANTVLDAATSSTTALNVLVRASYPLVTVNGVSETLTRVGGAYYAGSVAIVLPVSGPVEAVVLTPDNKDGAKDVCTITLDLPPVILAASFTGGYPGTQTELKENDSYSVTVTASKPFDRVVFEDWNAGKSSTVVVMPGASPQTSIVTLTVANRGVVAQQLAARMQVRDATTGALSVVRATNEGGGSVDGVDVVTLNNLHPSGSVSSVTYPIGQTALKGVETATVSHTALNYNTIAYTDPTGAQITISDPNTYASPKTVTCRNPGLYNIATTNFRYVLTRTANAAQTTVNGVVAVADIAPTITIVKPAARLRSGGNNGTAVQNHTITIQSNQQLLNAPTLNADSGGDRGTFLGSWAGGPSNWTRTLQVDETVPDEKGTFAFEGLVATGRAGLVQNAPAGGSQAYALGGFVARNLTFAAFAEYTNIGTVVVDFAKLAADIFTATNQPALKQPIGTGPSVTDGYTIMATGVNPTVLRWLDTPQVNANGSGTAQILAVQETV